MIGFKGLPATGGASRVGESIIEYLKSDYSITSYASASHADREWKPDGFSQIVIPKFPVKKLNIYFYYLCAYLHAIFFVNYHLIHVHLIDSGIFIPLLRLKYKNIVCTSHGRGQLVTDKFGKLELMFLTFSERLFLKYSERLTVVSEPLMHIYKNLVSKEVTYIPNGINLADVQDKMQLIESSSLLKKDDLCYKEYMLFSAGRIIPIKGCHLFLKSLQHLNLPVQSVIIGDINQIPGYKKQIETLMNEVNAKYIGFINEKIKLLTYVSAAKIFVFPSTYEAMSMMLLEAASVKTPIICSDIPENVSVFSNEEVLFFKSNNFMDLAEKINWALENFEEMIIKANKAYNKLTSFYTWDKISKQYSTVYKSLLN